MSEVPQLDDDVGQVAWVDKAGHILVVMIVQRKVITPALYVDGYTSSARLRQLILVIWWV